MFNFLDFAFGKVIENGMTWSGEQKGVFLFTGEGN